MALKNTDCTWIESRKKYRKRVKIGEKWHDVYGADAKEITAKIKELEKSHDNGLVLNDKTTLISFAKEWYSIKTASLSQNSRVMYQNAINVHIAPFFESMRLTEIRPLHVQKLLSERAHLSKSAQSKILMTLSQIMNSAEENGLISKNPCKGIKAGGEQAKRKTPLTTEQQIELVKAVKGTRSELFVLLCLYAGLRREDAYVKHRLKKRDKYFFAAKKAQYPSS